MGRKGIIALFVGVSVFMILLWRLDFFQHWDVLFQMDLFWFFLSASLMALHQSLSYTKWKVMYGATMEKNAQPPLMPIFSSVSVSGMITPARSGDVIASLSWKGIQGKVLAWSIFNRISEGLMTIVLSLCILGFFFHTYATKVRWVFISFILISSFLLIMFVFSREWGLFVFRLFRNRLQKLGRSKFIANLLSFEGKVEIQIKLFYETMEQFKKKHVLSLLIALTLFNRLIIIFVNMALLRALGIILPWTTVLGILAATWVSVFLSPIPGGFGVGDVAPSLILSHLGYKGQAGSFIILNHVYDMAMISFWAMMWVKTAPVKVKNSTK